MIHAEFEEITPEKAKDILAFSRDHFRNRPVIMRAQRQSVTTYAQIMRDGKWSETNGETIKIDKNGILKDGYHRLTAVVAAGVPIHFLVVRDVDEKAFETIDCGRSRTDADNLFASGIVTKQARAITGGVKRIITYICRGNCYDAWLPEHTLENIKKVTLDHKQLLEQAATEYSGMKTKIISSANFLLTYCAVMETNPLKGASFIYGIKTGVDLSENDPRRRLRELLLDYRIKRTAKINSIYEGVCVIKAWTAFLKGRQLKRIQLVSNYDAGEYPKFPEWCPTL